MIRFLSTSARHGPALLALGVFGGLLVPPLAHATHWFIAPTVVCMMTVVLLRLDLPAVARHLRRPLRWTLMAAFQLLVCPVIAWAAIARLELDPGLAAGIVIFATGCAATSSAAFARLVGLDPELSLIVTLATTLLVPLTAPPMAFALIGADLAIGLGALMARLAVVVGLPLCLSVLIRLLAGRERLLPLGPAIDGLMVWLVVFYGFAVMDGLTARLIADPAWFASALAAAFIADFGLNACTVLAFAWLGRGPAAAAGLMSGNRNMALYLAVLPAAADPRIALFFALCQFPLFLSPVLLRGLYRRLLR